MPTSVWSAQEGLVIRPGVTINDILLSARVRQSYPLLVACAQDLASHQIRNRATVIGNVANASPCADMSPALLCLGATVVLSSRRGQPRDARSPTSSPVPSAPCCRPAS